jgi:hypothetical protein
MSGEFGDQAVDRRAAVGVGVRKEPGAAVAREIRRQGRCRFLRQHVLGEQEREWLAVNQCGGESVACQDGCHAFAPLSAWMMAVF